MVTHGGGFAAAVPRLPFVERQTGTVGAHATTPGSLVLPDVDAPSSQIEAAAGFRHFIRTPRPEERCGLAVDSRSPGTNGDVRLTLSRLVKRMRHGFWPDGPGRDNPAIPSGYTYLLQFASHDLVQSSIAISTDPRLGASCTNLRDRRLQLATLYGGGPIVTPTIFAIDDPLLQTRARFRLGASQNGGSGVAACRDIARIGGVLAGGAPLPGLSEALIADPRNDDHAVVSQLTLLFQLLHNALVDLLPASTGDGAFPEADALHRFLCAREATTLIYQRIVRQDLLSRLLQPAVYRRYAAGTSPMLDEQQGAMPLEFSHAAFRLGHAMVRDHYVMNAAGPAGETLDDLLALTSGRTPRLMPLNPSWLVQWSKFFDLNGAPPNLSQRIGPQFSGGLTNERLFPHLDETQELGLPYRDLVSGAAVGLWSVTALIQEIDRRMPDLLAASPLASADRRQEAIKTWLNQAPGALTTEQIDTLASDPPLSFYILFEAAQEADGTRLGTLGSVIVAEVMFAALDPDPGGTLSERLEQSCFRYFAQHCQTSVPDLHDMAGLVTFVAASSGLADAAAGFI